MSFVQGVQSSYSLFGPYGVALVAKSRLLRRSVEVSVSVSGFKRPLHIRLRTTDVSILSEMLRDAEYDLDLPISPRVIVDAGANIGVTSVFYANKYPAARVFAIEPESSNYELLEKNAAPYGNITCIRAALWKTDTAITLADPGFGHWGFQTVEQAGKTGLRRVEGFTVSTLMKRFDIDYIDFFRVDIEGAEREVFEYSAAWIDRVGVVAIELHDRLKTGCSRAVYLATKGFQQEFRRGETVFFGRNADAHTYTLRPVVSTDSPNARGRRGPGKRPCMIVSEN
jgi:FkbM family methyltransferase